MHDVQLIVPLTDLDHGVLSRARGRARRARAAAGARGRRRARRQVARAPHLRASAASARRRHVAAGGRACRRRVPACSSRRAAASGRATSTAAATARELEFFLGYTSADSMVQACCCGEEFSIDVFCDLDGRCLNAVPRTMIESKGGESIKGMTIARRGADRGRPPRLRDARARRAREHPVLPRAGRHATASPTSTRASAAAFPLPTAAGSRYPELALALAAGERPEPRLGDFRAGLYMTRFFSELVLTSRERG